MLVQPGGGRQIQDETRHLDQIAGQPIFQKLRGKRSVGVVGKAEDKRRGIEIFGRLCIEDPEAFDPVGPHTMIDQPEPLYLADAEKPRLHDGLGKFPCAVADGGQIPCQESGVQAFFQLGEIVGQCGIPGIAGCDGGGSLSDQIIGFRVFPGNVGAFLCALGKVQDRTQPYM